MTHATKPAPRPAAISAALVGALALAGCSTGHIGDSWQCPLAEGGLCDSVAAADPAVPDPDAAGTAMLAEPLWRMHGAPGPGAGTGAADAGGGEADPMSAPSCDAACGAGFDPFAWFVRLLGEGEARDASGRPEPAAVEGGAPPDGSGRETDETKSPPAPAGAESRYREPAPAALPAAAFPAEPDPAREDPPAGDLRTGEVVARIWVAPFVDADGVYREASHVRVVLEPAGWRLK